MEDLLERINSIKTLYINPLEIVHKNKGDELKSTEWNETVKRINDIRMYLDGQHAENVTNIAYVLRKLYEVSTTSVTIDDVTERINDKITIFKNSLSGKTIKLSNSDEISIYDKIAELNNKLFATEIPISTEDNTTIAEKLSYLNSLFNNVSTVTDELTDSLSYVNERVDTITTTTYEHQEILDDHESRIVKNTENISYLNDSVSSLDTRVTYVEDTIDDRIDSKIAEEDERTNVKISTAYDGLMTFITDTTLTFDYDLRNDSEKKRIYDSHKDLYNDDYHE